MAREIEVCVDEWIAGDRGTILTASGVGAGMAIALSNLKTGQGYLGSLLAAEDMPQLLEVVKDDANEKRRDVLVWYGGYAFTPNNPIRIKQFRQEAARFLRRTEFVVEQELWLPRGKQLAVRLQCGTARCRLNIEDALI